MKKTLLIAAAALAAGIISTQASSVYSQNIVGYANIPTANAGYNYCISIPFAVGVSNGANEVFGTTLQGANDFTEIFIWNSSTTSYTLYQSDDGSATGWDDYNFNPVPAPVLPVGQGFFMIPSASGLTNTFTGSVAIPVGTTYTNTYPGAGYNYLAGSVVPYAGSITNNPGLNLNSLDTVGGVVGAGDFTEIFIWSPSTTSYTLYQTDSGSTTGWDDYNFNPVTPPSLNVGDGIFIIPSVANVQWIQSL